MADHDSRAADRGEILRGQAQSVYGSLESILGKFNARGRGAPLHRAERPPLAAPAPAPLPSVTKNSPPLKQASPGPSANISAAPRRPYPTLPRGPEHQLPLAAPPGLEHLRHSAHELGRGRPRPGRVRTRYFLEIFWGCGRLSGALVERGLAIM